MKSFLFLIIAVLFLLYSIYLLFFFVNQNRIIFPVRSQYQNVERTQYDHSERLWLHVNQIKTDAIILFPFDFDSTKSYPVILISHGNAEVIDDWIPRINTLRRHGMIVMLVEFPGYGFSEGEPDINACIHAFIAAANLLQERRYVNKNQLVYLGFSLGGGIACAATKKEKPAALVLINTFSDIGKLALKFGIPPFMIKHNLDNETVLTSFEQPVLIIHGKEDEIIPVGHAIRLNQVAKNSKLILLEGGHNDNIQDWDQFFKTYVIPFIEKKLLTK